MRLPAAEFMNRLHLGTEKRHRPRAPLSRLVRMRPSLPIDNGFDEVIATKNTCRDGFYAVTAIGFYKEHMRLLVTVPYSARPGAINRDYVAEVLRIDSLPGGRHGIAVRLVET